LIKYEWLSKYASDAEKDSIQPNAINSRIADNSDLSGNCLVFKDEFDCIVRYFIPTSCNRIEHLDYNASAYTELVR